MRNMIGRQPGGLSSNVQWMRLSFTHCTDLQSLWQRVKCYVTRLPTEIATVVRKYLHEMIREDVPKATTSILRCMTEEYACSVMPFPNMGIHRRARVVYAETSYERRWFHPGYNGQYVPKLVNKSMRFTFKYWNISLWDELDQDGTETVARLDRLNAGRVQRLRTEDPSFYPGGLALKLAGLQGKDLVTDRLCLQFGANSSRVEEERMSSSMPSDRPTCYTHIPKCLAEVIVDRRLDNDDRGYSALVTEYGGEFHAIREGSYLRWQGKDASGEERTGNCGKPAVEAGRKLAIVRMLSWFL